MFFRKVFIAIISVALAASCSSSRKLSGIRSGETAANISLPSEEEIVQENEDELAAIEMDTLKKDGPIIMNAIRDEKTGEMVATDVIVASKVTARFRHVAERFGKILLEFDITVPREMMDSKWQLRFFPQMRMMGDTTMLEPLFITGRKYRDAQLRGYQRYEAFVRSIITDSTDFVMIGQLELFLERYFPETFAMKTDTSLVSEPEAKNLFGVTQRDALTHYTRHFLQARNERKKGNLDKMFRKYVKDPISKDGIRLDTVMADGDGGIIYRYKQQVTSRPGLKKVEISLHGGVYDFGNQIGVMPPPEDLVFYVSSLSSLSVNSLKMKTRILERRVRENTLAILDFRQGSSQIDTTIEGNASELRRIEKCIQDLTSSDEFIPDSIIVTASCSPEGSYKSNASLAQKRAQSLSRYLEQLSDDWKTEARSIPENWQLLDVLVANDTALAPSSKEALLAIIRSPGDKDAVERKLSSRQEYIHLRSKIYPRLRTVNLEFRLHRAGLVKDTVHLTEVDTVYMDGVEALKNLDYKLAVELLRPYRDYNSALALTAAGYNWSALEILDEISQKEARVQYLKAIVYSRLEKREEAFENYRISVEKDPSMAFRANLDPELADVVRRYDNTNQ